jgi:lipoprotein NlpI/transglutaminase-like putative cysteine protease
MTVLSHASRLCALAVALAICLLAGGSQAQGPAGPSPFKEVQIAADAFSVGDPVPDWVETVAMPELGKSLPVVVRLADTQYFVTDTPVVYVRRALTVNDPGSLSSAGQISIPFLPEYQKLKLHSVRVLRGGESLDRTRSSQIRFLQRETSLERGIYLGEVTASVLVQDLRVGDTIEVAYSFQGQNPVFGAKFVDFSGWDQGPPTLLRRVVLRYPEARRMFWHISRGPKSRPVAPKESVEGGMRKLVFEERDMAKVDVEPLTPMDYPAYRMLHFSEFAGWEEVVAWASDLFQSKATIGQALREVIEPLRQKATEEERVAGALEFVQSQIRYFSVSLGESSHRPSPPDLVLERRYGDCKDKSLMLITMLDALGVKARPVLMFLGKRGGLDGALPSPLQFNHVIVEASVGDKTFYLDPTHMGQYGKLRSMGQLHEGTQVLVVAPSTRGPSIIATRHAPNVLHSEVAETAVLPKLDGDAELTVRQTWRGVYAESVRVGRERTPLADIAKNMATAMEQRYPGARLLGDPEIHDDRVDNALTITGRYSVPKFALERSGTWLVRYQPVNLKGALAPSPPSARTVPLLQPYFPYTARYTFEIRLPEEVSAMFDPRTDTVRSKYFTYRVTHSFRGNVAKSTVEFKTLADQVKTPDLEKYGEDVRAVAAVPVGVVAVPKSVRRRISKAKTAKSKKKDLGQTLKKRHEETIEKIGLAIKSGRLADADLVRARCLRSTAHADLGHERQALADADAAVKLAPNSTDAFLCRAYAHLAAGRFEESIADHSKAIVLGATEAGTLQRRGIARLYAGKLAEAAEDFTRASEAGTEVYADLWLGWTLRRMGRELPAALVERAKADPRGDWPRPGLALLAGQLDPEDVLKLLGAKRGDDREMALAEGYFIIGQHYLARGDKAKAREYFERTRRQNIFVYLEHMAAGFELKELGPPAETATIERTTAPPRAEVGPKRPGTADSKKPGTADAKKPGTADPKEAKADAKKAARRPSRKGSDDWTADVWK